jgi:hypothetical protein
MNSKFWLKLVKVRLGKSLWLMVEWGVEEGFFNGPNRRAIMIAQSLTKIRFVLVAYMYQS